MNGWWSRDAQAPGYYKLWRQAKPRLDKRGYYVGRFGTWPCGDWGPRAAVSDGLPPLKRGDCIPVTVTIERAE